jgi:hypothetical protein
MAEHNRLELRGVFWFSNVAAGARADAASDAEESLDDFNRFFPSFVWVLRDFGLALVDDDGGPVMKFSSSMLLTAIYSYAGNEISPDDYMENALAEQPGYDKDTMVRRSVCCD